MGTPGEQAFATNVHMDLKVDALQMRNVAEHFEDFGDVENISAEGEHKMHDGIITGETLVIFDVLCSSVHRLQVLVVVGFGSTQITLKVDLVREMVDERELSEAAACIGSWTEKVFNDCIDCALLSTPQVLVVIVVSDNPATTMHVPFIVDSLPHESEFQNQIVWNRTRRLQLNFVYRTSI